MDHPFVHETKQRFSRVAFLPSWLVYLDTTGNQFDLYMACAILFRYCRVFHPTDVQVYSSDSGSALATKPIDDHWVLRVEKSPWTLMISTKCKPNIRFGAYWAWCACSKHKSSTHLQQVGQASCCNLKAAYWEMSCYWIIPTSRGILSSMRKDIIPWFSWSSSVRLLQRCCKDPIGLEWLLLFARMYRNNWQVQWIHKEGWKSVCIWRVGAGIKIRIYCSNTNNLDPTTSYTKFCQ